MKTMELYRTLQIHVGKINALVVGLYHLKITKEEALTTAKAETKALIKKLEQAKTTG